MSVTGAGVIETTFFLDTMTDGQHRRSNPERDRQQRDRQDQATPVEGWTGGNTRSGKLYPDNPPHRPYSILQRA
jgi:hypothetical protein